MTNREWLQTLTDEELAKWHVSVDCRSCAYNPARGFCNNLTDIASFDQNCCVDGTAKWLQQEHKENNSL